MARIEPVPMDQADDKARALLDELVQAARRKVSATSGDLSPVDT